MERLTRASWPLPAFHDVADALATIIGAFLGRMSGVVAGRTSRGRPVHPKGLLVRGTITRTRSLVATGVSWIDQAGVDNVVVRLSRSVGLPSALPDVYGLALAFPGPARPAHLLLATAGYGAVGRCVPAPRRRVDAGLYGSLLPFRTPTGPLFIAARPQAGPRLPQEPAALASELDERPFTFALCSSRGFGAWSAFGSLTVIGAAFEDLDPPIHFDPVRYPVDGLLHYPLVARLRAPAYESARRRLQDRSGPQRIAGT